MDKSEEDKFAKKSLQEKIIPEKVRRRKSFYKELSDCIME